METENQTSLFNLEPSWKERLKEELEESYLIDIERFVLSTPDLCPPKKEIFEAFWRTPFDRVKVVIIGQDPYHGREQAHGLSFSVPKGVPIPPSLRNIYKELQEDVGFTAPHHGCLIPWAEQGVFLLNATLSVSEGKPLSHHGIGWERFTDAVVEQLVQRKDPIIFVLWGNFAQKKGEKFLKREENTPHYLLEAAHPSPLSAYRGFFGCRHFSKINRILKDLGKREIDWSLPKI